MAELTLGERVSRMEGILEEGVLKSIERMESKLDDALDAMEAKGSRQAVAEAHAQIDQLELAMEKKADKAELEAVKTKLGTELGQVKLTLAKWAGIGLVAAILLNWFGKELIGLLVK